MQFYLNDLYPNSSGIISTRTNTIPEKEDKEALAETGTENHKVTPANKKHLGMVGIVIIALILFFGLVK